MPRIFFYLRIASQDQARWLHNCSNNYLQLNDPQQANINFHKTVVDRVTSHFPKYLSVFMMLVSLFFLALGTFPANAENAEHSVLMYTIPASTPTPVTPKSNPFLPLSAETITFGYALPGACTGFSPDGKILATTFGVYEITTGKKRFFISGSNPYNPAFSPDGTLLAVQQDGIYEVTTGKKRFGISGDKPTFSPDGTLLAVEKDGIYEVTNGKKRFNLFGYNPAFSPDGMLFTLVTINGSGIYEAATGKERFPITGSNPVFSPDSSLVAAGQDNVYEVVTGKKRFPIAGYDPVFSPDSSLLSILNDGVYEVATGKKRFPVVGSATFSADGTLLAVEGEGVYEAATGKKNFIIAGSLYEPLFSPDGFLLAVPADGVYEVATGKKRFDISNNTVSFSLDGTLLAVASDGIYDTATGNKLLDTPSSSIFSPDGTLLAITKNGICALYGSAKNQWPSQVGVIRASNKNIRRKPNTTAAILGSADGVFEVIGRTTKGDWYQVIYGDGTGWIAASVVNIVFMPEDIPIVAP